jgi:hypothetical protein
MIVAAWSIGGPACCQPAAWLRGEQGIFAKKKPWELLGWWGLRLGPLGPFWATAREREGEGEVG